MNEEILNRWNFYLLVEKKDVCSKWNAYDNFYVTRRILISKIKSPSNTVLKTVLKKEASI